MQQLDLHILNLIDYKPQDYNSTVEEVYMPYMQQHAVSHLHS
jgi:hypothetical protein